MEHKLRIPRACALICLLSAAVASSVSSQTLSLDRWARQAGMGDASAAVFWGGDPDISVNPAVLAYHHGIRYSWSEREILPGIVDGSFSSHRVTAAHAGVGLAYATSSLDFNGALGYPIDQKTQKDWAGSIALAVAPLFDALATGRGGTPPRWTGFADVALGYSRNTERLFDTDGTELWKFSRSDVGGLVRLTPLDTKSPSLPVRLDLSYGWSALDVTEADLDGMTTEMLIRNGFASRIVIGWPEGAALPPWLQAPGFGSVRYDEAKVPQCCGIPDAWHQGFTASLDLLGILAASRR